MKLTKSFSKPQWLFIFISHLILLYWIFYILYSTGHMEETEIFLHFFGVSIFGALLIRFCAWLAKKRYMKEIEKDMNK